MAPSVQGLPPDAQFEAAVDQAAALLGRSAFPVIAGMRADVAAAAAAVRLAERLGGVFDHAAADEVLNDIAVLRDTGLMLVSPGEARRRADTVLIVGIGPRAAWPELDEFLFLGDAARLADPAAPRRILALMDEKPPLPGPIEWLPAEAAAIPGLLGALRARVNGRPLAAGLDVAAIDCFAEHLKSAKFGVALWSPGEIDALAIEMLTGLVKDLNAETRWSGLSVAADVSAVGFSMTAAWMTGFPLRVGFGGGDAEHDPWRFDARRMVASGEADALIWVAADGEAPPDWLSGVPAVILSAAPQSVLPRGVAIRVGRPGIDHDAILFDRRTGTLAQTTATDPRPIPTAADALNRIRQRLPAP